MVRLVLALWVVCLSCSLMAAVTSSVNSTSIRENDSIELTISYSGTAQVSDPDFSSLARDFEYSTPQFSSRYVIASGRHQASSRWTLILRPKQTGEITIPSFTIAGDSTKEIIIYVESLSEELRDELAQEIFIVTNVNRSEQYIHAAIHVERRLYYSDNVSQLSQHLPTPDDIKNVYVLSKGDIKRTFARRNNRQYSVLVQEFVLFPEVSGTIRIPSVSIDARVNLKGESMIFPARSEEVELNILPIPIEFPTDVPWFPSTRVRITDSLVNEYFTDLKVGDTIERTVTILAVDNQSSDIPIFEFPVPDGVRQYVELPDLTDEVLGTEIVGKRQTKSTILFTQAGEFTIPNVSIHWWNTDRHQLESAYISGRTVHVANADSIATGENNVAEINTPVDSNITSNTTLDAKETERPNSTHWLFRTFWMIGWIFAVILGTYLIWTKGYLVRFKKQVQPVQDRLFMNFLSSKDPIEVKEGMIRLLMDQRQLSRTRTLELLRQHPTTQDALRVLNAKIYGGTEENSEIDREAIKNILRDLLAGIRASTSPEEDFLHRKFVFKPSS
ncbi:MAG: protein BatD [Gammaproteobacteria bacterium]|nr:BatD family protein [Gammaproteobacteria bacterium]MXX95606.1 protein BatD [Gammaproteobacteria bacterium]MYF53601.1 protein BatD [Gammaproteobacteria bacterium]MYK43453.1 protein BatD [Gammaproteobacteria bacterium]